MSVPLTLPGPHTPEFPDTEDFEGCEFVDGEWRPKHPEEWVESEHDRKGCEFVDGEWRVKNMSVTSDAVIVNLLSSLRNHVRGAKLGRVQGPECGYQCFPDEPKRVRKPDASFIAAGRLSAEQMNGNALIAPDFAAEVTSPNDKADHINRKVCEYLSVGVKLIWLIYAATKSVWILRNNGSGAWLSKSGEINGEDVIPGLTLTLDTLFAEE